MQSSYKNGICTGCSEDKMIVYKTGNLCLLCNGKRLNKRYSDRAALKPKKPQKPLKRTPIKSFTKKSLVKIKADDKMYELVWKSRVHYCEECGTHLGHDFKNENGKVIDRFRYSHILSKGAFPEHRHNLLNFNLLCLKHHQQWETGDKESMKIWDKNKLVIDKLKKSTYARA